MGNTCESLPDKHEIWPTCCQTEHQSKSHFNFSDSPDQAKAQQWISRSLIPSYQPCRKCAKDLNRRYNDPHRKTIQNLIRFDKFHTYAIRDVFNLKPTHTTISIKYFTVKNLAQLGLTCGAPDFVDVVMKSMINGKKLSHFICSNVSPYNATDILLRDLENVLLLLATLNVSDIANISRVVQKINGEEYTHKFVNSELEFGTKPYGIRLKKSGGIFGYTGGKHGVKGKDCGGKASECAKIGKEKGGRPVGSKNCIHLTIELSCKYNT